MISFSPYSHSQKLPEILLEVIQSSSPQQITFAQYMALALYHQEYGYYTSRVRIGSQGDFFTSSSLGADFGQLLGIQLKQMWHQLGCPHPFSVVEMGAGNGELAQDVLTYFQSLEDPSFVQGLNYIIVERSPNLIQQQQERLKPWLELGVTWQNWSDLAKDSIEGCFFSNELVDAFPVHLVQKQGEKLQEVYLGIEDNQLQEIIAPVSTDKLTEYFERIGVDLLAQEYPESYRTEVNLEALDWLEKIASKLRRGYILTIDYGYSADKYYRPARSQGTLQCYYQHRRHHNPYVNLGAQDITCHVDFTTLELHGERLNLQKLGFTQQGLFLMALGLGDRLNELSSGKFGVSEIFKRRDPLHQLIDPTGLGGNGVLIQGKNLTPDEHLLQGLTVPKDYY